jgi:hypothetical protein
MLYFVPGFWLKPGTVRRLGNRFARFPPLHLETVEPAAANIEPQLMNFQEIGRN